MIIAIVGSRTYSCKQDVVDFVNSLPDGTVIVSGGAKGVDTWAEEAAKARGLRVIIFLPDWKLHGKAAGFIRNQLIIDQADCTAAFWDGVSKGTEHSMNLTKKAKKLLFVKLPNQEMVEYKVEAAILP